MALTAAELVAKISVSGASTAKAEIEGMGGAVEGAGSKLGMLAGGVALAAGAALVGLGVKSTKMAGDWQASMTRLYTSAGELKGNLSMVSSGLLKMAVDVGTSTDQMAKGMYYVESAGFHGSQGLQVLKMAAMGAKAENADLGTVANAVTSALNSYGLKADSAASVTNTLVAAVGHGKMTMNDLASAVSNVLPATSKFHISMIDTTAAIATMTMQGDDASSAATHLRQMILALESPAKAGATALREIGLSSQQVSDSMKKSLPDTIQMITDDLGKKFPEGSTAYNNALKNIAGGSKQLLGLLETSGTSLTLFKNNVKDMTAQVKAGGQSIMGWSDIQNTFNFKIGQAKAAIEAFGINVGTFLLPIAGKIVDAFTGSIQGIQNFGKYLGEVFHSLNLTEVKDAWNQFSKAIRNVEQAFGRLVGAIDPVKGDFDPFAEMIGNLAKGGLSIVSTLLRDAAGALNSLFPPMQKAHAALQPLTDNFDRCTQLLKPLTAAVKPLTDSFDRSDQIIRKFTQTTSKTGEAANPLLQVLGVLKGLGLAALNMSPLVNTIEAVARHGKDLGQWWQQSVIPALKQAEPGFKNLGQALAGLLPAFEQIAQVVHDQFQKSFDALLPIFKQVVPIVIQIAGALAGGLGTAIKTLTPLIVQAATAIAQFAGDIATRVAPIVKGFFTELNKDMPALKAIWNTIWPSMSTSLQAAWNAIVGTIKIAWALVSGIIKIGLDIMGGNWKQAWEDFKTMLSGIWSGIETIFSGAIQQLIIGFKPLFQMLANVPGPVGDMAKNVLKSMDGMNAGVSTSALQMKVRVLQQTEDMHTQAAAKMDVMRKELIQKMQDTADPVQKKALDMKIKTLTHMEDMQVQAAQKADTMKKNVLQKMQDMNDQAVGHSIIPDMVNSITAWFGTLVTNITGKASSFFSAGVSVVQGVINGINSMVGNVATAISGVAQTIADHLPHSPAKRGPLSKLNEFGLALVRTFANDITSHSPKAHDAAQHMVEGVAAKLKAYPVEIAKARLAGNTALVKSLEAARHQDELLIRDFKDELTIHGDRWSALHGILFGGTTAAHHATGRGRHAPAGAIGSLATVNNGARAFVGRGGERLNFSGSGATGSVSGVSGSGSTSSRAVSGQPIEVNINIDGKRVAKAIIPDIVALIRNGTGTLL